MEVFSGSRRRRVQAVIPPTVCRAVKSSRFQQNANGSPGNLAEKARETPEAERRRPGRPRRADPASTAGTPEMKHPAACFCEVGNGRPGSLPPVHQNRGRVQSCQSCRRSRAGAIDRSKPERGQWSGAAADGPGRARKAAERRQAARTGEGPGRARDAQSAHSGQEMPQGWTETPGATGDTLTPSTGAQGRHTLPEVARGCPLTLTRSQPRQTRHRPRQAAQGAEHPPTAHHAHRERTDGPQSAERGEGRS